MSAELSTPSTSRPAVAVVEEQAAVAAPELERRSVAALDRGAEQVAVVVVAVGRQPAVVRLGDEPVVGLG